MYSVEHRDGVALVAVTGQIDMASQTSFERLLAPTAFAPQSRIVVDLTHCTYIDSSALGVLVRTHNSGSNALRIVGSSRESVRRIFTISHLDRFFDMAATAEEALSDGRS